MTTFCGVRSHDRSAADYRVHDMYEYEAHAPMAMTHTCILLSVHPRDVLLSLCTELFSGRTTAAELRSRDLPIPDFGRRSRTSRDGGDEVCPEELIARESSPFLAPHSSSKHIH